MADSDPASIESGRKKPKNESGRCRERSSGLAREQKKEGRKTRARKKHGAPQPGSGMPGATPSKRDRGGRVKKGYQKGMLEVSNQTSEVFKPGRKIKNKNERGKKRERRDKKSTGSASRGNRTADRLPPGLSVLLGKKKKNHIQGVVAGAEIKRRA